MAGWQYHMPPRARESKNPIEQNRYTAHRAKAKPEFMAELKQCPACRTWHCGAVCSRCRAQDERRRSGSWPRHMQTGAGSGEPRTGTRHSSPACRTAARATQVAEIIELSRRHCKQALNTITVAYTTPDMDGPACYLCGGVIAPTTGSGKDHVVPRMAGGREDAANLRPCCRQCNRLKDRWTLEEFRQRCEAVVYGLPDRHFGRPVPPDRVPLYERILIHMGW